MHKKLRLVIAEDPVTATLCSALMLDETLEVVAVAGTGLQALELTRHHRPDAVVIDARIRRITGFEATRRIMQEVPTPVIVVADAMDLTRLSSEALAAGAVATAQKPVSQGTVAFAERSMRLLDTIRTMAGVRVVRRWPDPAQRNGTPNARPSSARPSIVAIASSTGGPAALHEILSGLPEGFSLPIVVVQHIAVGFVDGFARWLDDAVGVTVKVAEDGEVLQPGTVHLAPDFCHTTVERTRRIALLEGAAVDGHCPSGTVLFRSVAAFGPKSVCIVLTGMGSDGLSGLIEVRKAGGAVIAQDEATSAVFGMPKAALDAGVTDLAMTPKAIARYLSLAATSSLEHI